MALDLNKARKLPSGEIITMKGRLLYPSFFTASLMKGETDQSKAKFQGTLLIPKAADLTVLVDSARETGTEKFGVKTKFKLPFIKTEDQNRLQDYAEDYPTMIRFSSKDRPGVVNAATKTVNAEDEVYAGRWAVICLRPYAYDHPTGGKGVSFGLQHVQLLDHDEPMAGGKIAVSNAFEAIGDDASASSDSIFS